MRARLQSIVLVTAVIAAVTTSTIGYTGIWNSLFEEPYHDLKAEAYSIVDQAQLWYLRPVSSKGGGKSFRKLDFERLGYDVGENADIWQNEFGKIKLEMRRTYHFDLIIEANDGTVLSARNLTYDTRPVFLTESSFPPFY